MAVPDKSFVLRTRHVPPTYVGATFERAGRSSVFAFSSRRFAARVGHGLESQRRQLGHFPSIAEQDIQLDALDERHPLDHLDIVELDAIEMRALVAGSGVVLCYIRMDDDGDVRGAVLYDKRIQRTWIHGLYARPD
jgi:hypothetical protein